MVEDPERTVAEDTEIPSPEVRDFPSPPDPATQACLEYFEDCGQLLSFIWFISQMALDRDKVAKIAAGALLEVDPDRKRSEQILKEGGVGAVKTFSRFKQLLAQLVITRAVDAFLLYLADLLALIFRTRPETLRSSQQVRLETILQHSSMEDLIGYLADGQVQDLSYQGMRALTTWLEDRLGLKLFEGRESMDQAVRFIELRNLIVHNRGRVNRLFLTRVPDYPTPLNHIASFSVTEIFDGCEFFARAVGDIDSRAILKFDLPATSTKP